MSSKSLQLRRASSRSASWAAGQPTAGQIARIDALTATGRTNWFALLAYLAFALVTTLGVEDIDFFSESRETRLPIVGVAIPTFSFFVFAPILGAALYAYLHLHIRKVTEALSEPPAGTPPLETKIRPWLLNDFVLRQRRDAAITPRPLDALARCVTLGLIWLAGPIVLTIMWMRTWPAHALWLSGLCSICLMVATYAGALSWSKMRADVGRRRSPNVVSTSLGVALFCLPVAWLTSANSIGMGERPITFPNQDDSPSSFLHEINEWSGSVAKKSDSTLPERIGHWIWTTAIGLAELDRPDMIAAGLSVLPPEHADHAASRHLYRSTWCQRNALDADTCGGSNAASDQAFAALWRLRDKWCEDRGFSVPEGCRAHFEALGQEFELEWSAHRAAIIASIPKPSLAGRDIRRANAAQAHLTGVDFRNARMEGADFRDAQLERADFRLARMEGVDLSFAQMQSANLRSARLEGANLSRAHLQDANFTFARMKGADFRNARLEGASLVSAKMEGVLLYDARLEGADLGSAWMTGAYLTSARMKGANLLYARLEGANLQGALMEGAILRRAQLQNADFRGAHLGGADLLDARLQNADLSGTKMAGARLAYARLQGANLTHARLQDVDLSHARMEGADLSNAQMEGVDLSYSSLMGSEASVMTLKSTNLSVATNNGGALRFVDLRSASLGAKSQFLKNFRNSFGDATALLPVPNSDRPCQWSRKVLTDEEFYARWRGWLSLDPTDPYWEQFTPEKWHDVAPVLPDDPACTWQK